MKTRRGFLKLLGKASAVAAVVAVAPKTALGFKPQVKSKDYQGAAYQQGRMKLGDIITVNGEPYKVTSQYGHSSNLRPMTATEINDRREEFDRVNADWWREYSRQVFKAFNRRGSVLNKRIKRMI